MAPNLVGQTENWLNAQLHHKATALIDIYNQLSFVYTQQLNTTTQTVAAKQAFYTGLQHAVTPVPNLLWQIKSRINLQLRHVGHSHSDHYRQLNFAYLQHWETSAKTIMVKQAITGYARSKSMQIPHNHSYNDRFANKLIIQDKFDQEQTNNFRFKSGSVIGHIGKPKVDTRTLQIPAKHPWDNNIDVQMRPYPLWHQAKESLPPMHSLAPGCPANRYKNGQDYPERPPQTSARHIGTSDYKRGWHQHNSSIPGALGHESQHSLGGEVRPFASLVSMSGSIRASQGSNPHKVPLHFVYKSKQHLAAVLAASFAENGMTESPMYHGHGNLQQFEVHLIATTKGVPDQGSTYGQGKKKETGALQFRTASTNKVKQHAIKRPWEITHHSQLPLVLPGSMPRKLNNIIGFCKQKAKSGVKYQLRQQVVPQEIKDAAQRDNGSIIQLVVLAPTATASHKFASLVLTMSIIHHYDLLSSRSSPPTTKGGVRTTSTKPYNVRLRQTTIPMLLLTSTSFLLVADTAKLRLPITMLNGSAHTMIAKIGTRGKTVISVLVISRTPPTQNNNISKSCYNGYITTMRTERPSYLTGSNMTEEGLFCVTIHLPVTDTNISNVKRNSYVVGINDSIIKVFQQLSDYKSSNFYHSLRFIMHQTKEHSERAIINTSTFNMPSVEGPYMAKQDTHHVTAFFCYIRKQVWLLSNRQVDNHSLAAHRLHSDRHDQPYILSFRGRILDKYKRIDFPMAIHNVKNRVHSFLMLKQEDPSVHHLSTNLFRCARIYSSGLLQSTKETHECRTSSVQVMQDKFVNIVPIEPKLQRNSVIAVQILPDDYQALPQTHPWLTHCSHSERRSERIMKIMSFAHFHSCGLPPRTQPLIYWFPDMQPMTSPTWPWTNAPDKPRRKGSLYCQNAYDAMLCPYVLNHRSKQIYHVMDRYGHIDGVSTSRRTAIGD
jgi:hypothetical protein